MGDKEAVKRDGRGQGRLSASGIQGPVQSACSGAFSRLALVPGRGSSRGRHLLARGICAGSCGGPS